jgi:hypothetical protein
MMMVTTMMMMMMMMMMMIMWLRDIFSVMLVVTMATPAPRLGVETPTHHLWPGADPLEALGINAPNVPWHRQSNEDRGVMITTVAFSLGFVDGR